MKRFVGVLSLVMVVLFTIHIIGCSSYNDTEETPDPDAAINTEELVVTDATFSNLVLEADLPVVVDFGADWCPPCQKMDPIVEEVASENRESFLVAKLDTDRNPRITEKYRINALPTFIVFRDGKVIGRFIGGMPKARFVQQILDTLNVQGN